MTQANSKYSYSDLPSVDKLLSSESFKALLTEYGQTLVSKQVRDMLDGLRQKIRLNESLPVELKADDAVNQFAALAQKNLQKMKLRYFQSPRAHPTCPGRKRLRQRSDGHSDGAGRVSHTRILV